ERRPDPASPGRGRFRDLHAGVDRGHPGVDPAFVRRAVRAAPRGHRALPRAGEHDGDKPARARRHRRGSNQKSRAHPHLDALLLNEILGWVRMQSGTTSLRAILYMDEIFGFFPPVTEPPAKRPLLTLLKQARAFGLGVVLATQNPVDLDYKGLANTGTWLLG